MLPTSPTPPTPLSLRDQILNSRDLPHEAVEIAEWNGAAVHIRTMSGRERDEFEQYLSDTPDPGRPIVQIMRKLVAICLREPATDERMFGGDGEELADKNSLVIERLFDIAVKINQIRLSDHEAAVGKSTGALGDDSVSA